MRLAYLVISMLFVGGALSLSFATASPTPPPVGVVQPAGVREAATTAVANSVWWVGASSSDSTTLPNTGARMNIPVISFSTTGCLSFWVAEGFTNGYWGQVGYYMCSGSTPVSFYQIWNLGTYAILAGGMAVVNGVALVPTGTPTYSMYLQSGTTWAYAVGGTVMGTYNMGESTSSSTYPVEAYSEEQSTSVYAFPATTLSAIQVQNAGAWGGMATASSYGSAYGVQGNLQNSNLPKNEIVVGGSLPILPSGTKFWTPTSSSSSSSSATTSKISSSISSTTTTTTSSSSATISTPPTLTVTSTRTVTSVVTSTLPASTTIVTSTLPASTSTITVTTTAATNSTIETVVATETFCVQGNPSQGVACSGIAISALSQRGGPSLTSIGVGGLLLAGAAGGILLLNRRRSRNRSRTRIQSV